MKIPPAITETVVEPSPEMRAFIAGARGRRCPCGIPRGFRDHDLLCTASREGEMLAPRPTVARLLADAKTMILARRAECYGSLQITDAQADELSRALVQLFQLQQGE